MKITALLLGTLISLTVFTAKAQKINALQVDSLTMQLDSTKSDTVKAEIYRKIASYYMNYQIVLDKRVKRSFQDNAINYTIKAIHAYSRYNDTMGLRSSFNDLVKLYREQKKYPQAKWFVLQSNALSRQLKDVPNTIASLLELANIKMQIKDYNLAMRDLNEALALSSKHKLSQQEADVQMTYAMLYTKLDDTKRAAVATKRHDIILDSMIRTETTKELAAVKAQDSVQQVKKKLYTYTAKKTTKGSSYKKTVSL